MNSPEAAEELTLEQEIAAAMEQAQSDEPSPVEEGPARGADGKFVAKEVSEPVADGDGDKGKPPVEVTAPADDEQPAIPDKFALAPNYAKKATKENWATFSPEVRRELHERENEIHRQFTRFDEERQFGKQVKEVVAPYEPFIRSLGADPVQAFDYLIKTDYALRTAAPEQRKAMFLQAARDYGINFADGELASSAGQQPTADPRFETLSQQIARLEQAQQSAIQAQQLQEQQGLEQQVNDFATRADRPFFDRVAPLMATLLQSGQVNTLDEAYDQAVYADPETRALQLAAEQSQRTPTSQAAVAKAKAASASVTGAPGIAVPASSPQSSGSLEDDIRAAMQAASGRI